MNSASANTSFNIDAALLPELALTLDGRLSAIEVAPMDSMRATLALAVKRERPTAVRGDLARR